MSRRLLVSVVSVMIGLIVTGCGGLHGLDGSLGAKDVGGLPVMPGQPAEFTGYVTNDSGRTVTFEAARMLARPGFAAPKFRFAVVQTGLTGAVVSRGWPLVGFKYASLKGFELRNGQVANVVYSVESPRYGTYVANGVAVTVSAGGSRATVDAIGPGLICVVRDIRDKCSSAVEAALEKSVFGSADPSFTNVQTSRKKGRR